MVLCSKYDIQSLGNHKLYGKTLSTRMSALKIPRLKGSACKVKASFNLPVVETSDSLLLKVSPAYMHVRTGRSRAHTNAGHCDMRTEYSGAARVRPVSSETTYGRSAELRGAYDCWPH